MPSTGTRYNCQRCPWRARASPAGDRHHRRLEEVAHVARSGDTWWVHIDGRAHEVTLHEQGSSSSADEGGLKAPMPGTVLQVLAKVGQGSARAST